VPDSESHRRLADAPSTQNGRQPLQLGHGSDVTNGIITTDHTAERWRQIGNA
jgi:hypothetical protein